MVGRVSTTMMFNNLSGALQNNLQNLLRLQQQQATQRKYFKLSDNPSEIARGLALETSIIANSRFIETQKDGVDMLLFAEQTLLIANDVTLRIRDLVIQAGNGSLSRAAVNAIADEIDALKMQLLDTLNAKIGGRYIFGGTKTTTRPFVMDG